MSHISAIVCTSNINGFVFVNGFCQGPCKSDAPISVPWDGNTPLFISFTPEGGNYLNTSLAFTNMSTLPVCDNVELTLWTGVVEVYFKPKKSVIYPPPLLPEELLKESFTVGNTNYSLSLIDYCGIWMIIENRDNTSLCEYLSDRKSNHHLDIISTSPLLIHIRLADIHYAVTDDGEKLKLHRIEQSSCTIDKGQVSFISSNPLAPVNMDFIADDNTVTIKKYLGTTNDKTPKQTAINFLSNIIAGDIDNAYSHLSVTLQRSFTKGQIADFIGDIHTIVDNKYFSQAYENSLAVLTKQSDNVNIANAYAFEIDSMNKINNITPL